MKKQILILLFLFGLSQLSIAERNFSDGESTTKLLPQLYINISAGNHFYYCQNPDYDFIRAGTSYYSYSYDSKTLSWFFDQIFANIKLEYRFYDDRFWISSGFRYSNLISSLGRYSYYGSSTDFFYVTANNSENTSNFYRVQNIDYSAHYLGLPLELRYSPFDIRFFRLFFKAGTELNFLLNENNNVTFYSSGMDENKEAVLNLFNSSPDFYGNFYLGAGIHLGKPGRTGIRLEANFPVFPFSSGSFGLVEPTFGGGVELSIVVPLKF